MFKVSITNTKNGNQYGATFPTQEQVDAWIGIETALNSWGLPDRWLEETDGTHTDTRTVLVSEAKEEETIQTPVLDEEGNQTGIQELWNPAQEAIYRVEFFFPKEYEIDIQDITVQHNTELAVKNLISSGKQAREACHQVLDLIVGANLHRELTSSEVSEMQTLFEDIHEALKNFRPRTAKVLIENLTPDGIFVTNELKAIALQILQEY
jgi:hypothetical protein